MDNLSTLLKAGGDRSAAFDLLHERVRRWIWRQGWDGLRDIQEGAIPLLIHGMSDLIISAGTASGKTEAAFLPIISSLAAMGHTAGDGYAAVYISPMKALINNQFERMESLCEDVEIPVFKWHGDVSASKKQTSRKSPGGVVLITPESLEGLLINRGGQIPSLFRALRYIVIDEMHAFLDVPRGKQLQSILHRLDRAIGRTPARVGLSATLADIEISKLFLRPLDPGRVLILPGGAGGQELQLQVKGYVSFDRPAGTPAGEWVDPAEMAIHKDLFRTLQGGRHLVFAGSRNRVESIAVALSGMTEVLGLAPEFFTHHGSLAKETREYSEARMKDRTRPASIVCTSTLEMGVDVGDIETVAQIGPGHTVSGMRQRVGRTGRRKGKPSVMRVYLREHGISECVHPLDMLRRETVQSIAMINLMLQKWNEPPTPGRLDLSTALHQILALIAQHGGLTPAGGWDGLVKSGVFDALSLDTYKALLRRMAEIQLVEQARDGTLLLGEAGEKLLMGRDIYSVFMTPDEYKVLSDRGKEIGQIPMSFTLTTGQFILLGGRRWLITNVDDGRKEIHVTKGHGGKPPQFGGEPKPPADEIISEMRRVYEGHASPIYLDKTAAALLSEARESYDGLKLRTKAIVPFAENLLIFPWVGARRMNALFLTLAAADLSPEINSLGIELHISAGERLLIELRRLADSPPPDAKYLASLVEDRNLEKFDHLLGDELTIEAYASEHLDCEALPSLARSLLT